MSTKVIFQNAVKTISTAYTISYMIFCWWMGTSLFMHNSLFFFGLFSFFNTLAKRVDTKTQERAIPVSLQTETVTTMTGLPE